MQSTTAGRAGICRADRRGTRRERHVSRDLLGVAGSQESNGRISPARLLSNRPRLQRSSGAEALQRQHDDHDAHVGRHTGSDAKSRHTGVHAERPDAYVGGLRASRCANRGSALRPSPGSDTYPGGRYLDLDRTATGVYQLDFNLAYSPNCYFSPVWICPIPPRENQLPIAVLAGERVKNVK
jgi:hypothetical protein